MWMHVLRTTEDAASLQLALTYPTALHALVIQDTLVMVSPVQVTDFFLKHLACTVHDSHAADL